MSEHYCSGTGQNQSCLGVEFTIFNVYICVYFTLQAMAAIPYIDGDTVQQNLDRVRTYFELLNMPFEVSKK